MIHRPDLGTKFQSRYKEPDWAEKKQEKLDLEAYSCEKCEDDIIMSTSCLHHLSYKNFDTRSERMSELQILCKLCHKKAEQRKSKNRKHKRARKLFEKKVEIYISQEYDPGEALPPMEIICNELIERMKSDMAQGGHRWPGFMFEVFGDEHNPQSEEVLQKGKVNNEDV